MKRIVLFVLVITMPLAAMAAVLQTQRFARLESDVRALNVRQELRIEENKSLLTDIAELSSPERIENIAKNDLMLEKKPPEDVLQVHIVEGRLR
jgi:cell division protein FtsL